MSVTHSTPVAIADLLVLIIVDAFAHWASWRWIFSSVEFSASQSVQLHTFSSSRLLPGLAGHLSSALMLSASLSQLVCYNFFYFILFNEGDTLLICNTYSVLYHFYVRSHHWSRSGLEKIPSSSHGMPVANAIMKAGFLYGSSFHTLSSELPFSWPSSFGRP